MSEERVKSADEKYCQSCGAIINKEAEICPKCGVRVKAAPFSFGASGTGAGTGDKQRIVYILLGVFLGCFGIHNFYAGYNKKAITQLIIALVLGWVFGIGLLISWIWSIIDIVTITNDSDGEMMS